MVDVRDIQPSPPIKPIRRRWHAPEDAPREQQRRRRQPDEEAPGDDTDDGHIDEYA